LKEAQLVLLFCNEQILNAMRYFECKNDDVQVTQVKKIAEA